MSYFKGLRLGFEATRAAAFGAVGATYSAVGNPTENQLVILGIVNGTDKDIFVSLDGVTDQLYLGAGDKLEVNVDTLRYSGGKAVIRKGTTFYVKRAYGGAPGSGNVVIMAGYLS